MMLELHNLLIEKAPLCFPPATGKTKCGLNFNLLEDIVCGTQARLCLYLLTPETGLCIMQRRMLKCLIAESKI